MYYLLISFTLIHHTIFLRWIHLGANTGHLTHRPPAPPPLARLLLPASPPAPADGPSCPTLPSCSLQIESSSCLHKSHCAPPSSPSKSCRVLLLLPPTGLLVQMLSASSYSLYNSHWVPHSSASKSRWEPPCSCQWASWSKCRTLPSCSFHLCPIDPTGARPSGCPWSGGLEVSWLSLMIQI
jgi:hypothetical protein